MGCYITTLNEFLLDSGSAEGLNGKYMRTHTSHTGQYNGVTAQYSYPIFSVAMYKLTATTYYLFLLFLFSSFGLGVVRL